MMRRLAWGFACVVGLIGAAGACSDPATHPAPAVVTGTPPVTSGSNGNPEGGTDAGADASDGGGVCTDLANSGNVVDREGVPNDPPTATGGTVVDGDYDLTAYAVYVGAAGVAGPTGITAKASIRIAAAKIDEVIEIGGTGKTATTTTSRSAYAATGATFAETELCPGVGGGKQLQFTATDTTLILTDPVTKEALTFTKR